ncbi:MAG: MarR family transcriptional regulator [Gammaproteobacteria bacterium]
MSPSPRKSPAPDAAVEARLDVGRLLKKTLASLMHGIDERMQPLGLTAMQWEPLARIYFEKVDTVAALARGSQVNCGSMTRMLDRLETKDLLRRQRSATDRRVVHLELTAKGKKLAREIRPLALQALDRQLQGFAAAEVSMLTRLLGRMVANGSRSADDTPHVED